MAENAENRAGRRRRRWIVAAWATVAALIVLPLVILWATMATGEGGEPGLVLNEAVRETSVVRAS